MISVIGDGSLTGGMAYEALNNAAEMKTNFIIVLNDNHMSISKNVGGMSSYLGELRTAQAYTDLKDTVENVLGSIPFGGEKMVRHIKRTKSSIKQLLVPGMFFEDMGIKYLGPVDGHDLKALCRAFTEAKRVKGPVLVHVLTKKGKGISRQKKTLPVSMEQVRLISRQESRFPKVERIPVQMCFPRLCWIWQKKMTDW